MRRTMVIGLVILGIVAAVGIGVGAYSAGVSEGAAQELARSGDAGQAVRVVGHGYGYGYGRGFGFPFGLILFPLFVIGIVLLLRGAFWRGRWGGPGWGPGGPGGYGPPGQWGRGGPAMFEEWHRRQHDPAGQPRGTGEPPARTGEPPTSAGDEPAGS
jgi:hypothetical protein